MKLLRLYAAIALLRGAGVVAGVIAGPDIHGDQLRPAMHPAERVLLASLTGLAICLIWIAATWRDW
jgi:hypothetical protein